MNCFVTSQQNPGAKQEADYRGLPLGATTLSACSEPEVHGRLHFPTSQEVSNRESA
jgi:hypothetical protein